MSQPNPHIFIIDEKGLDNGHLLPYKTLKYILPELDWVGMSKFHSWSLR